MWENIYYSDYIYDYLQYDDTNVPNGEGTEIEEGKTYTDEMPLFGDGYCDSDPSKARWKIQWRVSDGSAGGSPDDGPSGTATHFGCQVHDADGNCFTNDKTDCCNSISYSCVDLPHAASLSTSNLILLPLSDSQWLSYLRNESVAAIDVPLEIGMFLAHLTMAIVEPVSASASEVLYIATHRGAACYKIGQGEHVTDCSLIVESEACVQSYQGIVGRAVVAPCKWSGAKCGRSGRPYSSCPADGGSGEAGSGEAGSG